MPRYLLAILMLCPALSLAGPQFNILTNPDVLYPPGCIVGDISNELPPPEGSDQILQDVDIEVPIPSLLTDGYTSTTIRMVVWRYACWDSGYSVVLVHFERGDTITSPRIPTVRVYPPGAGDNDYHRAHLVQHPEVTTMGAAGNVLSESQTYILQVERETPFGDTTVDVDTYNDTFQMELTWRQFAGTEDFAEYSYPIWFYDPMLDPPQTAFPLLHGRYSGTWVQGGKPDQGMLLQVAELPDGDRYVFVSIFTYIDGQPVWVTGNSGGSMATPSQVEMQVYHVTGGEFFTADVGEYTNEDIVYDPLGTVTIEPGGCNELLVAYDFTSSGMGGGILTFTRLVNIAGYTCNNAPD